ncbi:MAG TPA: CAP domain-containing protein [Acidobacteriaceae bacterium]|nr:CAP domain-containing protein [Acidobacteriaceae bacterium]
MGRVVSIAATVIFGTLSVSGPAFARAQHPTLAPNSGSVAEQYLLAAANQERLSRGLNPLRYDPQLARAANFHAHAMAEHGTISHQFAGEPELTQRGASAGVGFSLISENVGEAPDVVTIHDMWMHSEHHRSNLLDPAIDSAGISVVVRGGEFYAVEDFAKTVRHAGLEQQESAIVGQIERLGRVSVVHNPELIAAARQTCTMSSGFAGERRPWFIMRFTSDSLSALPEELKSRINSPRYHQAAVGACPATRQGPFTAYNFAVLLYP